MHIIKGIICNNLVQAALHRIELFRCSVARLPQFVMGRSGRTDPERRKAQKGQKAQKGAERRRKAQKGAERDFLGRFRPKKSVKGAAAQPVVGSCALVRSGSTRAALNCKQNMNGYKIGLCNMRRSACFQRCGDCKSIRRAMPCKALNGPYFAFSMRFSISIAVQRQNGF